MAHRPACAVGGAEIQRRFGFSSADGVASIGRGMMDEVWKGAFYTLPFLWVGTWRRIMFPETGRNIPFTIENYAWVDPFGRETVSWIRTFQSSRTRRFDAYMIYSDTRGRVVDYLGSHQHLAVDVRNRTWGRLFGYRGSFDVEWRTVAAGAPPAHILPRRQERRE